MHDASRHARLQIEIAQINPLCRRQGLNALRSKLRVDPKHNDADDDRCRDVEDQENAIHHACDLVPDDLVDAMSLATLGLRLNGGRQASNGRQSLLYVIGRS